jgi:hypothetical protein
VQIAGNNFGRCLQKFESVKVLLKLYLGVVYIVYMAYLCFIKTMKNGYAAGVSRMDFRYAA